MTKSTVNPIISEYMASLGRAGGAKNKEKGREYFSNMGKISAKKRWDKYREDRKEKTA